MTLWRLAKTKEAVRKALKKKIGIKDLKAIGLIIKGETVLVWDKTGIPAYNAIV